MDNETGLDVAMHRFYDPKTGTWLTQDPRMFEDGETNLYDFVDNNPTNESDPSGEASIKGVGIAVGQKVVDGGMTMLGWFGYKPTPPPPPPPPPKPPQGSDTVLGLYYQGITNEKITGEGDTREITYRHHVLIRVSGEEKGTVVIKEEGNTLDRNLDTNIETVTSTTTRYYAISVDGSVKKNYEYWINVKMPFGVAGHRITETRKGRIMFIPGYDAWANKEGCWTVPKLDPNKPNVAEFAQALPTSRQAPTGWKEWANQDQYLLKATSYPSDLVQGSLSFNGNDPATFDIRDGQAHVSIPQIMDGGQPKP